MSDSYFFRQANSDDLPLILNWTEALMQHEALDDSIEIPLQNNISELLEKWLKNLVKDDNSLLIIATKSNENVDQQQLENSLALGLIIGHLQLQPNEFSLYEMHAVIQLVWVEKEERNKGLARQLVSHMEDTFKNLDVPYCEIQYSSTNKEAEGFWNKAGYKVVSTTSRKFLK